MYADAEIYGLLMDKVSETVIRYLNAQIEAGAEAVQIFDTWGGILSPADYVEFVLPYSKRVIAGLDRSVPVIHFVRGAGLFLDAVAAAGGDVLGIDWHIDLADAIEEIGPGFAVQGNLDPTVLLGPRDNVARRARAIVEKGRRARGHVFNLGHGILPPTPVDNAIALVEAVHEAGRR
jgi:uroporphyrinogen decarboxylase